MNEIKNDPNERYSSNLLFSRENHFQEDLVNIWPQKIDSDSWKCPIFISSLQNFGETLEKNKYVELISDQNWSSIWMPKILNQS